MTEKQRIIKQIFNIKDKNERIKAIQEYMIKNVQRNQVVVVRQMFMEMPS